MIKYLTLIVVLCATACQIPISGTSDSPLIPIDAGANYDGLYCRTNTQIQPLCDELCRDYQADPTPDPIAHPWADPAVNVTRFLEACGSGPLTSVVCNPVVQPGDFSHNAVLGGAYRSTNSPQFTQIYCVSK